MSTPTRSLRDRQTMDDVMLGYVEWREESAAVQAAYDRWSSADREDTVCAHAAYRAALDREEAAATIYAEVIERVRAPYGEPDRINR